MKKVLLTSLFGLFLLFGLSFTLETAEAFNHLSVSFNAPINQVFGTADIIALPWTGVSVTNGEEVINGNSATYTATACSGSGGGGAYFKLKYNTESEWVTCSSAGCSNCGTCAPGSCNIGTANSSSCLQTGIDVVMYGAATSQNGCTTFKVSFTFDSCSNVAMIPSTFQVYTWKPPSSDCPDGICISSTIPPPVYYSTDSCPQDSFIVDGICISATIPTPILYTTNSCSDSSFIADGICIQSTMVEIPPIDCNGGPCNVCPQGSIYADGICLEATIPTPVYYSTDSCPVQSVVLDGICISTPFNQPPAAHDLAVDSGSYCSLAGIPASGLATFQWTYYDVEREAQTRYQLQVSTSSGSNFEQGIVLDTGAVPSSASSGDTDKVLVPVLIASTNPTSACMNNPQKCNFINYGVHYYWRAKVWKANTGFDSGWVSTTKDLATSYIYPYAHPAPAVRYTVSPLNPAPAQTTVFSDNSTCYSNDYSNYPCSDTTLGLGNTYSWWFENSSNSSPDLTYQITDTPVNVTHVYTQSKTYPYPTALRVCDSLGCCAATLGLKVGNSNENLVPQWSEVSPYQ